MSDFYSPLYLTVDALGRVGATFTGKIHALGVDIPAAATETPPDDQRIRWIDEGAGGFQNYPPPQNYAGELIGYTSNSPRGNRGLEERSFCFTAIGEPGQANVCVYDPEVGGGRKMVDLRLYDPTTSAIGGFPVLKRQAILTIRNDADTGSFARLLLNSAGVSDYLDKFMADAAGDLLVGTADNAIGRLPVGENGAALVADSGVSGGMRWAPDAQSEMVFWRCSDVVSVAAQGLNAPAALTELDAGFFGTRKLIGTNDVPGSKFKLWVRLRVVVGGVGLTNFQVTIRDTANTANILGTAIFNITAVGNFSSLSGLAAVPAFLFPGGNISLGVYTANGDGAADVVIRDVSVRWFP